MDKKTIDNDKTIAGNGIGTMLAGRYRILRQLGEGRVGAVWLAEDWQLRHGMATSFRIFCRAHGRAVGRN